MKIQNKNGDLIHYFFIRVVVDNICGSARFTLNPCTRFSSHYLWQISSGCLIVQHGVLWTVPSEGGMCLWRLLLQNSTKESYMYQMLFEFSQNKEWHVSSCLQASFLTKKLNITGKRVNLAIWVGYKLCSFFLSLCYTSAHTWPGLSSFRTPLVRSVSMR